MTFGLISEGITDQKVIENILYGYTGNPDIICNPVQPSLDATDIDKQGSYGGWGEVFNYCKSQDIVLALALNDWLIIQIDTDTAEEYDISRTEGGIEKEAEEIAGEVANKILALLHEDALPIQDKIIFAIAVHSIECWLLPLYTSTRKDRTLNCLDHLERALKRGVEKNAREYEKLSRLYRKRKELEKHHSLNPSFGIFIRNLDAKFKIAPEIPENDQDMS